MTGVSVLLELGADVEWPDDDAAAETRAQLGDRDGELRGLAAWLAGAQACAPPRGPKRIRLVRLGDADTAMPSWVPADVGVRSEMCTETDVEAAVRFGAQLADDEVDRGADLVVLTVSGATRAAVVLISVLTDTEPVKVLARTAAIPPGEWMAEAEAVRDARRSTFGLRGDPLAMLAALAAPSLSAATGFLLRAAARRTPLLVEGTAATAAGLVAFDTQPRSARWWRPADSPGHPAARIALSRMALDPVLSLGTDRADGTVGLLAAGIVRAAAG